MKHFDFVRAFFVSIAAMASLACAQNVTVVEYRNKTLDAYFITGRVAEQQLLDSIADFSRTGMSFQASAVATAPSALTRICRFYVSLTNPYVNSHFYGKQGTDCEAILAAKPAGFTNEGFDFAVLLSTLGIGSANDGGFKAVEEVCPNGTTAVRRGFRALNISTGKTSNHRYTVSSATATRAASAGYTIEGVQFCVTLVTDEVIPQFAPPQTWTGVGASYNDAWVWSANVTWTLQSFSNGLAVYAPSGTVSQISKTCGVWTPDNAILNPNTGNLTIDYNVFPPTYHGIGVQQWPAIVDATSCGPLSPPPFSSFATALYLGGSRGVLNDEATGQLSPDGLVIQGADTDSTGTGHFNWYFSRK